MSLKIKLASAIIMFLAVLAALVIGVLAAQSQTINMQGTINFEIADRSLYVKSASIDYGDGQERALDSFAPGYINGSFTANIGEHTITNTNFKIYFDIINTTDNTYYALEETTLSSELQGKITATASGTINPTTITDFDEEGNAIITPDTETNGRVTLTVSAPSLLTLDLSGITITINELQILEGFEFRATSDDTAELVSYIGSDENVVIPSSYSILDGQYVSGNDYTVTAIADAEETSWGVDYATAAFYNVTNTLQSVTLPNTLKEIGMYAFYGCDLLTEIIIPEGVEVIGESAFSGCDNLLDISIPNSIKIIEENAIKAGAASENKHFNVYENGNYLGNESNPYVYLFRTVDSTATTFVIHPDCKIVEGSPTNITTITIPSGVTSIGRQAFGNCTALQEVIFESNNSLINIGYAAFSSCSQLSSIEIPVSVTSIGDYAFSGCSSLESITIPSNVSKIGARTFQNCSSLESINVPEGVTSIGDFAFSGCSSLQSINIPNSVISIGGSAFLNCTSLATVTMSENSQLTSIGGYAFNARSNLTQLTLPATLSEVGTDVFSDSLEKIYFLGTVDQWVSINFSVDGGGTPLQSTRQLYINDQLVTDAIINTDVKNYVFGNYPTLSSVTFGENVTNIGQRAFEYCSISELTISSNIKTIDFAAFRNCSSLTTITIESEDIYEAATSSSACGYLLDNSSTTTVRVLKSIVDGGAVNSYITSTFTNTSEDGNYYVYSK